MLAAALVGDVAEAGAGAAAAPSAAGAGATAPSALAVLLVLLASALPPLLLPDPCGLLLAPPLAPPFPAPLPVPTAAGGGLFPVSRASSSGVVLKIST